MFKLTLTLFLSLLFNKSTSSHLPQFLHPCSKITGDEERLHECMSSQTKDVLEALKNGIPDLKIPPLDPLYVDYLPMSLHDDFTFSLSNIVISGLTDCTFNRLFINITQDNLQMSIHFKKITIMGSYKVQGFVFITQVDSSGSTSMVFDDVILNAKIPLTTIERDHIPYLSLPSAFDVGVTFTSASLQFDNLFPKEPVLDTILNRFINDNIEDLFHVMRPGIMDILKHNIRKLLFKMFNSVPLNEIFTGQ